VDLTPKSAFFELKTGFEAQLWPLIAGLGQFIHPLGQRTFVVVALAVQRMHGSDSFRPMLVSSFEIRLASGWARISAWALAWAVSLSLASN